MSNLNLLLLNDTFSIIKLPTSCKIPVIFNSVTFLSITKTEDEISIICNDKHDFNSSDISSGWKCFKIDTILDFSLTGILSSLIKPLADEQISVFVFSTFNTDYIMVKKDDLEKTIDIFTKNGNFIKR